MQKYFTIFRLAMMDNLEYRWNNVFRALRYSASILLISLVWIGINKATPLAEITQEQIIRYYVMAAVMYSLSNFHTDYIEEDIRLGYISKYLVKPISAFWFYFIRQGTLAFFETVVKMIIFLPILFLTTGSVPWSPIHFLLFLLCFPFIFLMMFSLYFGLSTLAFWFQAVDSLRMSTMFVFRFLSGIFMPLSLMPLWFLDLSRWLPFGNNAFWPIELLEGHMSPLRIGGFFLSLLSWALICFLFQQLIWRKAVHSYESTGI